MATIRKRKEKYVVIYDFIDDTGKRRQKWETCETKAEATKRKTKLNWTRQTTNLLLPQTNHSRVFSWNGLKFMVKPTGSLILTLEIWG